MTEELIERYIFSDLFAGIKNTSNCKQQFVQHLSHATCIISKRQYIIDLKQFDRMFKVVNIESKAHYLQLTKISIVFNSFFVSPNCLSYVKY